MRVLHLSPELPYFPGGTGGQTREFFMLRRLAELGDHVLSVAPADAETAARAQLLAETGVEVVAVPRPPSKAAEAARAAVREPASALALATRPWLGWQMRVFWASLRGPALAAIERHRPDVVVVDHDMAAGWVDDLPAGLPAVLVCQNLTWNWYLSRARAAGGPLALAWRLEAARYRSYVLRRLGRYAAAVTVSTLERDELERIGRTRVELIPSGVDVEALRPAGPEPDDGPPRLLFTGTMSYGPNHQGIAWFVERVWPRVRARVPGALLDVVGRNPPPSVTRLSAVEGVTVTGAVPEMAPYFARAWASVVPILTGAGIRIKIVEALAAGRAVVSTSLGAEGLTVEPGRHLLLADGEDAFADAAVRLLTDGELRRRLAAEGRALAEREYDWRGLGDRVQALLAQVAESPSRA